jgi:uncharacterized membrane protein
MSLLGTIATAAVVTLVPGAGIALAVWKFGKDAVLGSLKAVATWLFLHPMTLVAIAAGLFALLQWHEARHWKKTDAGHVALIADVKREVDRGVGQPTRADQSPIWIHRFVDNVNVLDAGLKRQNAAAQRSHVDAEHARADAHTAGQTTAPQREREKDRQAIVKGTGALTPADWGKL